MVFYSLANGNEDWRIPGFVAPGILRLYNRQTILTAHGEELMRKMGFALLCAALLVGTSVKAQDYNAEAKKLMERADVKKAFAYVDSRKDEILNEWINITEINAPSGKEKERAEAVRKLLESYKL